MDVLDGLIFIVLGTVTIKNGHEKRPRKCLRSLVFANGAGDRT